jgi:hypothetical protein
MNDLYTDRPFLIAVLSPILAICGLIGVLYSLSRYGYLNELKELEDFLLFTHKVIFSRSTTNLATISFVSFLLLLGSIGLWSMRLWGAMITIIPCLFLIYSGYFADPKDITGIAINMGIVVIIIFHFKEYN